MAERVSKILSHLKEVITGDDEIIIADIIRTPIGRKNGVFKDLQAADLASLVIKGIAERNNFPLADLSDIACGNVLLKASSTHMRMAALMSGVPEAVPIYTVNRQCSSGLQALINAVDGIKNRRGSCGPLDGTTAGVCDQVALAVGVESMTHGNMMDIGDISENVFDGPAAKCLIGMGETSDNVVKLGVSRLEQDEYALESHKKASYATKNALFNEIHPVVVNGMKIDCDEGIRNSTLEKLSSLNSVFSDSGTTTAGNSSQMSDGAAAALVCTQGYAKKHGLKRLARIVSYAVTGCPPEIMGIGPSLAIPMALQKAGLKLEDIDVFEINEAFSSQFLYCAKKLQLPMDRVNPYGGAIAIGHPLGCSGLRMVGTLISRLKEKDGRYGIVSMCIGTGMGAACVIEVFDE